MSEGNGTAAAYIDERANSQQRESLSTIISGQAGGPPARFAQMFPVNNFLGIKFVPISFRKDGHQRGVTIPGILDWQVEGIIGADGNDVEWLDNIAHSVNTRISVARGTRNTYRDHEFNWDNTGQNGHFAPFSWTGP